LDTVLTNLFNHLEEEYKFLTEYLHALKAQTGFIVGVNVSEIQDNVALFDELAHKNNLLDETRQRHFHALAEHFQVPAESLTLTKIIEEVEESWKQKLLDLKEKLTGVIGEIQQTVNMNEFLLNNALDFTHSIIKMNDEALKADSVYSKSGRKETRPDQLKMLDQRI
jgi:hypothetical protein